MLWVDKHRPMKMDDLSYHNDVTIRLRALTSNAQNIPHLFIYGPSGSGKKTRIATILRELYGPSTEKLRLDTRTFVTPTKRTIDIHLITSNYHIELTPSDAGLNDRYVIQEIVKEMASNKNIITSASISGNNMNSSTGEGNDDSKTMTTNTTAKRPDYKTIVLMDCDTISRQAQAALRRTMEKYSTYCRFILCCNSTHQCNVMEPLRSRCYGIRIPAPSIPDICTVLQFVAKRESITLPPELSERIAIESSRNVRRAILMLEACHVQNRDGLKCDQVIQKADWEVYISQIAMEITREQTPQRLITTREKVYELLVNCIPATMILKTLVKELIKNLDDTMKQEIYEWAAFYEHRIAQQQGGNGGNKKEIFHLEAFIAKYMALYKRYLNELFG